MDWLMDLVLLPLNDWRVGLALFIIGLYFYLTWNFDYLKKMGVPHRRPIPGLGTAYIFFTGDIRNDAVKAMQEYGMKWGGYLGTRPVVNIADENILREILVKQFTSFPNHGPSVNTGNKYMNRMLTVIRDDEWRHVRRLLTPTFTAGKLKRMAPSINRCGQDFVDALKEQIKEDCICDVKIFCGQFTMDVIATTAFGLETNTQKDPNNEFVRHGRHMLSALNGFSVALVVGLVAPKAIKYMAKVGLHIFSPEDVNFFVDVVDQILEMRAKDGTEGSDFMGMMASAHKMKVDEDEANYISPGMDAQEATNLDSPKALDKVDIIGAGFIFFIAGFDTVSTGLSVTLYHLAANQDCQQKLYEEVMGVMGDQSLVTYDLLTEMPYLDMCIMESLRLDPPVATTDREVACDTTIDGVHFKKGLRILIPINAIHHYPGYYPNPDKFDPERFTPEAKAARSPYTFLPFGVGPRDCIGKRLALMEMKIALIYILRDFCLQLAEGNKKELSFSRIGQLKEAWVRLEKRELLSEQ